MILFRVHKLRGKAFYNKLREEKDDMVTLSFDCQKNLVNPKVQDQVAYYSRQLYTYNFTIIQGTVAPKVKWINIMFLCIHGPKTSM